MPRSTGDGFGSGSGNNNQQQSLLDLFAGQVRRGQRRAPAGRFSGKQNLGMAAQMGFMGLNSMPTHYASAPAVAGPNNPLTPVAPPANVGPPGGSGGNGIGGGGAGGNGTGGPAVPPDQLGNLGKAVGFPQWYIDWYKQYGRYGRGPEVEGLL